MDDDKNVTKSRGDVASEGTVDLLDLVEASSDLLDDQSASQEKKADTEHKVTNGAKTVEDTSEDRIVDEHDDSSATEDEGGGTVTPTTAEDESDRPTQHFVTAGETLAAVAAKYDVTPSELAQHNRLGMGRMIFPGQILKIPPPAPPPPPPKPPAEDLEVIEYQFIKLKVRHITAGRGVVSGSILFTPNAVIFDPDPKDPLVEELEPEAFQIIAPMEFVVNAAIFLDFFPIGNTASVSGREHPPSQIFRLENPKTGSLKKEETFEGSSYSLSVETSLQAETSHSNAQSKTKEVSDSEEQADSQKDAKKVTPESDQEGGTKDQGDGVEQENKSIVRSEPYYLRLTMGRPVGREVSKSTPTMAYGLQTMMPEYWFIVPSKQVLNLYRFFMTWFPEIYVPFDLEEIHEMGFELIPEPDLERAESNTSINSASSNNASKIIHKTMTLNSMDLDVLMPDMETPSELLSDDQRKFLYRYLPPRIQGNKWSLLFSTSKDGYSLHNLYRKAALIDTPVLIVIQDTDHAVFGALISCPPVMSETFLGTGESWLFTFFPSFKVYSWTGENNFIVRGGQSALVIGSSQGHFGLWLDESFNQGRSMSVATFNNKPLPGKEDFQVNNLECWYFEDIV